MNEELRRTGDSIHEVISAYSGMVYRLAYARTGNRVDAEDVFQDVFLKYFAARPSFASEEHRKAWLIRATVHTSVDLFRSAWRRLVLPVAEVPAAAGDVPGECAPLADALCRLSGRDRVLIHLFYEEEMRTEEIADMLGMKPATVRSRLSRSRETLRGLLTKKGGDSDGQA